MNRAARPHIVAAHQPAYLPWLGYFDRIAKADTFVFLDDVQFEKNSFTNRNQIKTEAGPTWLTLPVLKQGHTSSTMMTTEIDPRVDWRKKHLQTLKQAYCRAPHFEACFPQLEALYSHDDRLLADVCWRHLAFWMKVLGLSTKLIRQHELGIMEKKSALVLAICKAVNADVYLSGPLGRDYLDVAAFERDGVAVSFHEFAHPTYDQIHGVFTPRMGVVDAWMNLGDRAGALITAPAR